MKNILIFSNPFGTGPAGKAISIAQYITEHSDKKKVRVFVCGSAQVEAIAGGKFSFIRVDERNENEILNILKEARGDFYVISSQNRFAIRVAQTLNIPSAFLDGLAWFWKAIPEEHFLADIIFWLNYPKISNRIPLRCKDKIFVIHGITKNKRPLTTKESKVSEIFWYIGGCANPLVGLPTAYLDLCARLIEYLDSLCCKFTVATDFESQEYLKKYSCVSKYIQNFEHDDFVLKLSSTRKFITNGGQTATTEAMGVFTPVSFFLPVNLSQLALVGKLNEIQPQSYLDWRNYINTPEDIYGYSEKDAIGFFNKSALYILNDKDIFRRLCEDFYKVSCEKGSFIHEALTELGTSGAGDIYSILKDKWGV